MPTKLKLSISISLAVLSILSVFENLHSFEQKMDMIYKDLLSNYQTIETLVAQFNQTNLWPDSEIAIESKGTIYISHDRVCLIYEEPQGQKLILDQKVYIIDSRDKNIMIADLDTNFQINPINIVSHYWQNSQKTIVFSSNNEVEIKLSPDDNSQVYYIKVVIDRTRMLIMAISYHDWQNNQVHFTFNSFQINLDIDSSVFEIPSVDGYTIIDQSR